MIARLLLFTGLFAMALLASWPLRLGLAETGLAARSTSGSVWRGRLEAANVYGIALGDLESRLAPQSLLAGTLRLELAGPSVSGAVVALRRGGGIADVSGQVLPGRIAGLPVAAIDLAGLTVEFTDGRCTAAAGNISIQPAGPLAALGPLAGAPRCAGDAVIVPLAANGARLEVRITAAGLYRSTLVLDAVPLADRPGLLTRGFAARGADLVLSAEGRL